MKNRGIFRMWIFRKWWAIY